MRSPFQNQPRGSSGQQQRWQHSLQDQRRATRGSDAECVLTRHNCVRVKLQRRRADRGSIHVCPADFGGGSNRCQMLPHQSRLFATGTHVLNCHRRAGNNRQRQRRPDNLPTPFALRAVDVNDVRHSMPLSSLSIVVVCIGLKNDDPWLQMVGAAVEELSLFHTLAG